MDLNNSGGGVDQPHRAPSRIPPPHGYALSGKITLSAIVVLFTVVLLILFIHLYARWHVYRRESRRRRRRNPLVIGAGDHAPSSIAAPRRLDPKVLNSLAVVIFSSKDDNFDDEESDADVAAECPVCLNEFEDGEKVRVLPRCNHRFHIGCIDMWFGSHNSCPLCRSPVEIESPPPAAAVESESPPSPPQQCAARSSESSSDSVDREVSVEIRGGEGELGLGLGSGQASGQKSRILAIMRFLSRDPRLSRGEADLERGEGAVRTPPPPPAAE